MNFLLFHFGGDCSTEVAIITAIVSTVSLVVAPIRHAITCACAVCWNKLRGR